MFYSSPRRMRQAVLLLTILVGRLATCCTVYGQVETRLETIANATPAPVPTEGAHPERSEIADQDALLVVIGAQGNEEYGKLFSKWADRWRDAAEQADATYLEVGRGDESTPSDHDRLHELLALQQSGQSTLWIVLIGHGTFYQDVAKFNLRGPDVSANELHEWLQPLTRRVVLINCASSSGPFINRLSGSNRVVVTATKSGAEQNYARFGAYLSESVQDPSADLDHDGNVSLLEAFLMASDRVERFYEQESRLATEHAILDDNGDGLGTNATFFRGARTVQEGQDGAQPDGTIARHVILIRSVAERQWTAEQRARADDLTTQLETLRRRKSSLDEDQYFLQLEALLLELARLDLEASNEPSDTPAP